MYNFVIQVAARNFGMPLRVKAMKRARLFPGNLYWQNKSRWLTPMLLATDDNVRAVITGLVTSIPAGPFLIRLIRRTKHHFALSPPFGWVHFGNLDCTQPISDEFGADRGQPVDRLYIENFMAACSADIKGRVLEFGDRSYTQKFGGNKVTESDVWDVTNENRVATIIGDLPTASHVPSETFDCIVCTQTLGFIYDVNAAVKTIHRILKPGGVLLLTVGGISRIGRYDWEHYGIYWRFTSLSISRLLEDCFLARNIKIETCGNVYAAIAFLEGLAVEELDRDKLEQRDFYYQVLITARAVKEE
jgi:SAM-dependent methyltransferase